MNWYLLAVLACPVSMGVMMWLMMRPGKKHAENEMTPQASDAEMARLRTELDELRAAQRSTGVGTVTPTR